MQDVTPFESNQTLLFTGDSITDCGRRDAGAGPLGVGYVEFFFRMLRCREPQKKVTVRNTGIGGNTVDDLRSRWEDEVLGLKPDWLSIKIGINDCNRCLCNEKDAFLNPDGYEKIYDQILTLTKKRLPECRILLISPFFMSQDATEDSYRAKVLKVLPEYIAKVEALSKKHGTGFLDLQSAFVELRKHLTLPELGNEAVHPNGVGHHFIAERVWDAFCAMR